VWYQQVCHFHHDYWSVNWSHPVIAVKLLKNKVQDKPEVYSCSDFGLDCNAYDYAAIFKVKVHDDSIGFAEFEKFQGVATMWDGVRRNFKVPFLWILPLFFLVCSGYGFRRLWRWK
jgi:hypothetical protein